MKKTSCLIVSMLAVSLLLPAAIFAEQALAPLCPQHLEKTCFMHDKDYYCSVTENVAKTKVTRGRAGMLEVVMREVPEVQLQKCAATEHPAER